MATYHALAVVSQAIVGMLKEACPKAEFGNLAFDLFQFQDMKEKDFGEGVSLYLYRVEINGGQRNQPPRLSPDGTRFRPSLPLDLHYLVSVWARDAVKQQHLFGWCMRTLEDTPILPSGLLNHFSVDDETFHPHEAVELLYESLSLQDMNNILEGLRPQLSAPYVARVISIESQVAVTQAPSVQTREFQLGRGAS